MSRLKTMLFTPFIHMVHLVRNYYFKIKRFHAEGENYSNELFQCLQMINAIYKERNVHNAANKEVNAQP